MRPNKLLGQHFLKCRWVADTMIKAADLGPRDTVLEIGPGTGALTRELAKHAGKVIAVEKDKTLAQKLLDDFGKEKIINIKIVKEDVLAVLKSDFNISKSDFNRYKVVANIPYYLTSRLIRLLLESDPQPEIIVLTIQKEVAQRIVAKPPKMNLLALAVQIYGKPEIIKSVSRECFSPKPQVESAVIKISKISRLAFEKNRIPETDFFQIAKALFAHRRKTILNNLSAVVKKSGAAEILKKANISPQKRAEELSIDEIVGITRCRHRVSTPDVYSPATNKIAHRK